MTEFSEEIWSTHLGTVMIKLLKNCKNNVTTNTNEISEDFCAFKFILSALNTVKILNIGTYNSEQTV